MSDVTGWYPATLPPAREGFYKFGSDDRLHWDGRTWGMRLPDRPGVRFAIAVEEGWRWRGLSKP